MIGAGRRRILWRLAWSALLVVVVWFSLAFVQVYLKASEAGSATTTATADAVVVLGAAQYNGEPSPVLRSRLDTAFALWESGAAATVITTGANQPGDSFTEGFAGFQYLRRAGIPERQLLVIVDGGDTYESLLAVFNQLDASKREILVVTDAYHALRSKEIAEEVGFDPTVVSAGDDQTLGRMFREAVAVGLGRLVSFRRLSAWR